MTQSISNFNPLEDTFTRRLVKRKANQLIGKYGYTEIDRARLIRPTLKQLGRRGGVTWSHPAFANRRVYIRNDEEILCADLAAK